MSQNFCLLRKAPSFPETENLGHADAFAPRHSDPAGKVLMLISGDPHAPQQLGALAPRHRRGRCLA
jgi:hypothetical protein